MWRQETAEGQLLTKRAALKLVRKRQALPPQALNSEASRLSEDELDGEEVERMQHSSRPPWVFPTKLEERQAGRAGWKMVIISAKLFTYCANGSLALRRRDAQFPHPWVLIGHDMGRLLRAMTLPERLVKASRLTFRKRYAYRCRKVV